MSKKSEIILKKSQLRDLLGPCERPPNPSGVLLRSEHYLAIGCDLGNNVSLDELLAREIDDSTSLILCTAEVSITYMNTEAADTLIRWAGQYSNST